MSQEGLQALQDAVGNVVPVESCDSMSAVSSIDPRICQSVTFSNTDHEAPMAGQSPFEAH
jgi:hypothetical protein